MSWDSVVAGVNESLPHFNDYLLKGYMRDQVAGFPEFISTVFEEAILLFKGKLKYLGYHPLSPIDELRCVKESRFSPGEYNIQRNETELIQYDFEFENKVVSAKLNLPYLHENCLVINDTKMYIQSAITECTIYRAEDGAVVKVMRSPINFSRGSLQVFEDTKGRTICENTIQIKVFFTKKNKKFTPLILYLLARYDFDTVVNMTLGYPAGTISFVADEDPDSTDTTYFKCAEGIYLRCPSMLIAQDLTTRRYIASVLTVIKKVKEYSLNDLYNVMFYKTVLGRELHGASTAAALAADHANSHLDSLSTYLDQHTKRNLTLLKPPIYCNDVFDLLVTAFVNIDEWVIRNTPNDLFAKRIGGADMILKNAIEAIFRRTYDKTKNNKNTTEQTIGSALNFAIDAATKSLYRVNSIQASKPMYNDNDLISIYVKRMRQSSTQERGSQKHNNLIQNREHHFHPSFMAIESPLAISSASPGISGDINPFAVIDKDGYFRKEKMPWYEAIEPLSAYLAK